MSRAPVLGFVDRHRAQAVQRLHEFALLESLDTSLLAGLVFEQPTGSVLFRYELRHEAFARLGQPGVREAMPPGFYEIVSTALLAFGAVVPIVAATQSGEWALFFVDPRPPFGKRPAPRGVQ